MRHSPSADGSKGGPLQRPNRGRPLLRLPTPSLERGRRDGGGGGHGKLVRRRGGEPTPSLQKEVANLSREADKTTYVGN